MKKEKQNNKKILQTKNNKSTSEDMLSSELYYRITLPYLLRKFRSQ